MRLLNEYLFMFAYIFTIAYSYGIHISTLFEMLYFSELCLTTVCPPLTDVYLLCCELVKQTKTS